MTNLKRQTMLEVKKWPFKWPRSELGDMGHILPYLNPFSGNFMTNVGYNFSRWADIKSAPTFLSSHALNCHPTTSSLNFDNVSTKRMSWTKHATNNATNTGKMVMTRRAAWMPSNQSCGLNNCIITAAAQFIKRQSDKGIFWSIMWESRSHMSPNVWTVQKLYCFWIEEIFVPRRWIYETLRAL